MSALVGALHSQCVISSIEFQIQLIDDASTVEDTNYTLTQQFTHTSYTKLPANIGRAAIRNVLAQQANYANLLFIDCDSMPSNANDYIKNYIPFFNSSQVVYGGRAYTPLCANTNYYLHWLYGTHREVKHAAIRNQAPYKSFLSNNFLVKKSIITAHPFNANITQYGHEDTLWAMQLSSVGVGITHIDNPLLHIGLDDNAAFIAKTQLAISNLKALNAQYPKEFSNVKLVRYASIITRLQLRSIVVFVIKLIVPKLLTNLGATNASLKVLDVLKLYWLLV